MEQRRYSGNVWPEGLADFLVQEYEGRRHTHAQKIGREASFLVQIGDEHRHHRDRVAVTVGITQPEEGGLVVTVGEQQWISPDVAEHAIVTGLIGALITPWALLGLIGPAGRMLGFQMLPDEIWNLVDTYVLSMGGTFVGSRQVTSAPVPAAYPPAPAAYPPGAGTPYADTQEMPQPVGAYPDGASTQKLDDPRFS